MHLTRFAHIAKHETVALHDLAKLDVDGLSKPRGIPNEGVEFAVFAAGIHTGRKFAEQRGIEWPATLLTAIIGSAEHFRSDLLWYCALSFWVSASEDHGQFHLGRLFNVIAPVTPVLMTRAYISNEFSRLPASLGAEQWCLHGDCWAVAVSAGSNDVVGSVIHLDILPCVRSEAIETVSHRRMCLRRTAIE